MCRHELGDTAAAASATEVTESLLDLEPICDLPPLALPVTEQPAATTDDDDDEAPVEALPLEDPRTRPLVRNRNVSEIFGSPDEPDEPDEPDAQPPSAQVAAPRPAVLVSKEGFEIAVSDVSPSAAIAELVDAAWKASSTPQLHGIVRVYMPFSTASVRRAAAMIQASVETRRVAVSRKRKSPPLQDLSGGPVCRGPKRQLAVAEPAGPQPLPILPTQPPVFVHGASADWSADFVGATGGHAPLG